MLSNDGQTDRQGDFSFFKKSFSGGGAVQTSQCSVLTALCKSVFACAGWRLCCVGARERVTRLACGKTADYEAGRTFLQSYA